MGKRKLLATCADNLTLSSGGTEQGCTKRGQHHHLLCWGQPHAPFGAVLKQDRPFVGHLGKEEVEVICLGGPSEEIQPRRVPQGGAAGAERAHSEPVDGTSAEVGGNQLMLPIGGEEEEVTVLRQAEWSEGEEVERDNGERRKRQ